MDVKTKLKKVINMSPAEIRHRIAEQYYITKERKNFELEREQVMQDHLDFFDPDQRELFEDYKNGEIGKLFKHPAFIRRISEPLTKSRRDYFTNGYPHEFLRTIERANQFLKHKFSFLGVTFTLPESIPWQSDPVSLTPYDTGFYRDIDVYVNSNSGDVKHVWEVNRLQFMIEIAKAAYLTEQKTFITKIETLIEDWYKNNPYKTGIAWASALEVGVRVISLIWILNFYLVCRQPRPQTVRLLLRLIYLHGRYLEDNLSFYSSPYNHLIGEAAGLFMVGFLFPGFRDAQKWEKKGWSILEDQISKQFHSDGASVEQATFYHHFTLGFFIQAVTLRRLNGFPVSPKIMTGIEKALEFAMFVTKPDGNLPYIGDIDDGRSICFSDPTNWDFTAYQAIGAAWFERSDMKFVAHKYHEDAFWILSDKDARTFKKVQKYEPERTCVHLKESGYSIFRNGYKPDSHYSQMDCGPIAHGVFHDDTPSAAHGHADLLAIEIAAFGESFLVDPGFSNYRGEFSWHTYFRSTAAHNTIEIDGQSQAKHGDILFWSRAPRYKILQTYKGSGTYGVCAEHHGYRHLDGKPDHRRYFLFIDHTFWLTLDEITTKEKSTFEHQIKYNLHFGDEVISALSNESSNIICNGRNSQLFIQLIASKHKQLKLISEKGGTKPYQGWISPTYLDRRPAPHVIACTKTALPYNLLTLYVPNRLTDNNRFSVRQTKSKIVLTNNLQQYDIYYDEGKWVRTNLNNIDVCAKLVVHKKGVDGRIVAVDIRSIKNNGTKSVVTQYISELTKGE